MSERGQDQAVSPSRAAPVPTDVLDVLVLPSAASLSEQQVRGVSCVWDGIVLTPKTAVGLGEQTTYRLGEPVSWYPRACRRCIAERAHRGLFAHGSTCGLCASGETAASCTTGRGLYRLVREYRR